MELMDDRAAHVLETAEGSSKGKPKAEVLHVPGM